MKCHMQTQMCHPTRLHWSAPARLADTGKANLAGQCPRPPRGGPCHGALTMVTTGEGPGYQLRSCWPLGRE